MLTWVSYWSMSPALHSLAFFCLQRNLPPALEWVAMPSSRGSSQPRGRTIPTACELLWAGTMYESCATLGWILKEREQITVESRVSLLWRAIPHQWAPLVLVVWVSRSLARRKSYKKAFLSMALVKVTLYTDLLWPIGIRTSGIFWNQSFPLLNPPRRKLENSVRVNLDGSWPGSYSSSITSTQDCWNEIVMRKVFIYNSD